MTTDPYEMGKEAYLSGKPEISNPFDPMDNESSFLAWVYGWADAELDSIQDTTSTKEN